MTDLLLLYIIFHFWFLFNRSTILELQQVTLGP